MLRLLTVLLTVAHLGSCTRPNPDYVAPDATVGDGDSDSDSDADADSDSDAAVDGGSPCGPFEVLCPDGCFSLADDRNHCGDCRRSCRRRESCRDGRCG